MSTRKGRKIIMAKATTPEPSNAETTDAEIAVPEAPAIVGMFDFATLAEEHAPEVRGFRLVDQAVLEAVPFVIVGINIRDGVKRMTANGPTPTNYLSVECVTADTVTLERLINGHAIAQGDSLIHNMNDLKIAPNECVVFNDGSTGVARQLVNFLHQRGIIDVGDTSRPNGPMGESSFDRYHGDWKRGGRDLGDDRAPDPHYEGAPLLKCMRGLRRSDYQNDFTTEGITWYLG